MPCISTLQLDFSKSPLNVFGDRSGGRTHLKAADGRFAGWKDNAGIEYSRRIERELDLTKQLDDLAPVDLLQRVCPEPPVPMLTRRRAAETLYQLCHILEESRYPVLPSRTGELRKKIDVNVPVARMTEQDHRKLPLRSHAPDGRDVLAHPLYWDAGVLDDLKRPSILRQSGENWTGRMADGPEPVCVARVHHIHRDCPGHDRALRQRESLPQCVLLISLEFHQ